MAIHKSALVASAVILCVAAASSSYWSNAFQLNQTNGLIVIATIEAALFIWVIKHWRRSS